MRALVLWADPYSSNLGVRALGAGTEALMRRIDPSVEIRHQGFGPGDAPVRIGSPRRQARRLLRDTEGLVDWVQGFDVVLDTRAGDSFADIYGLRRLLIMNMMQEVVRKSGVPVIFVPQTIGPFATRRGRFLGRRGLHTAAAVMARDPRSAKAAEALGRPADLITTDVVFSLPPAAPAGIRDVIMNVSGLLWAPNPHVDHSMYREFVTALCERLVRGGRCLTLLSHVIDSPDPDNDVPASNELAARLAERGLERPEVLVPDSLDDARGYIASGRFVVGARMHACLNALSLGIPALPLSYSRKFAPLLSALGWHFGIDLQTLTGTGVVQRALESIDDPTLANGAKLTRERAHELLEPVTMSFERVVG